MTAAQREEGRGRAVPFPGGRWGIHGAHPGPGKAPGTRPIPRDTPSPPHTRPLCFGRAGDGASRPDTWNRGTPTPFKGPEPLPCPRGAGAGSCSLRAPEPPPSWAGPGSAGWESAGSLPGAQIPLAMRSPAAGAGCSPRVRASHTISQRGEGSLWLRSGIVPGWKQVQLPGFVLRPHFGP